LQALFVFAKRVENILQQAKIIFAQKSEQSPSRLILFFQAVQQVTGETLSGALHIMQKSVARKL
jgi:hypothetical protein